MSPGSVIIFCSGIAASIGLPYYSAGSALCGAVNSMTRSLAVELAPRGIRVNAISPGLIEESCNNRRNSSSKRSIDDIVLLLF